MQYTVCGANLLVLVKFYMFWYTEKIGAFLEYSERLRNTVKITSNGICIQHDILHHVFIINHLRQVVSVAGNGGILIRRLFRETFSSIDLNSSRRIGTAVPSLLWCPTTVT